MDVDRLALNQILVAGIRRSSPKTVNTDTF